MHPLSEYDTSTVPETIASDAKPAIVVQRPQRKRGRLVAAVVLLLLIVVFVPPFINIGRFRRSIVRSISAGIGRPVEAGAVELRLFPLPGFVLHHLTIAEDPAYGAEPVMTAETVTAVLRPSTLWHARVEIATLRFDTPSVNLVRNAQGHWNFESLLRNFPVLKRRNGGSSTAPMPFPYVQASDARINFKFGAEKLPLSLEQANLALWKESNHDWRVRIRARPVRTDLTVEDAGEIRGNGELRTGGMLMNAPVRASLEWRHVQLGEISRLLRGQDDGWRGTVDWTAHVQGTLADVSVISDIGVEEFRRAEFIPVSEMDVSAHCQARYDRDHPQLDAIACNSPLGDGRLSLRGQFHAPLPGSSFGGDSGSLQIALDHAPAGFFLDLLGHVHPGVPTDTSAAGTVDGTANCDWPQWDAPQNCAGEFRSTNLRLHLVHVDRPLTLSPLLLVSSPGPADAQTDWRLLPTHVFLGGATPATIAGALDGTGSALRITGPADLADLSKLMQSMKIPAISGEIQSIRGGAQLALLFESTWLPRSGPLAAPGAENESTNDPPSSAGSSSSLWGGGFEIHDARLKLAALPLPFHLASASVNLLPGEVQWTGLKGSFAHTSFYGSIQWQTSCPASSSTCERSFALHTANLNAGHLQAALRGGSSGLLGFIPPWSAAPPGLPRMSGTIHADAIAAGRISLKDAALELRLHGHSADLLTISGQIFGGKLSGMSGDATADLPKAGVPAQIGAGSIRWGDGAPAYTLRAQVEQLQPNQVAAIWNERWGRGGARLQLDLKTQGWTAADLADNARGRFSLDWENGSLETATSPKAAAPEDVAAPATTAFSAGAPAIERFQSWRASGIIRNRQLVLESSRMIAPAGSQVPAPKRRLPATTEQSVTGTITFTRTLDLKFHPSGLTMTGPLNLPVVSHSGKSPEPNLQ